MITKKCCDCREWEYTARHDLTCNEPDTHHIWIENESEFNSCTYSRIRTSKCAVCVITHTHTHRKISNACINFKSSLAHTLLSPHASRHHVGWLKWIFIQKCLEEICMCVCRARKRACFHSTPLFSFSFLLSTCNKIKYAVQHTMCLQTWSPWNENSWYCKTLFAQHSYISTTRRVRRALKSRLGIK